MKDNQFPQKTTGLPENPILRISTEMHTAVIRRIDTDEKGRLLITCSHDKTLKLWDIRAGRLKKTIRVPIDEGNDGKLYACALSPDGRTIAAGGYTGWDWDGKASIYIFDIATGEMIKRISRHPYRINRLSFSRDNNWLVATFKKKGIRIYNIRNWEQVDEDTQYEYDSYWADFDIQGRLVTTCYDGFIRLYDSETKLITREKTPGGNRPFSCAFSPEGKQVAVGFHDCARVDVLSGDDLKYLYSPDTTAIDNGNLMSVAWSSDGKFLFAGGRYSDKKQFPKGFAFPILCWPDQGKAVPILIPASGNTIMDILPLPDGSMIYGAYDPAWGIIRNGKNVFFRRSDIADHRCEISKRIRISEDATIIGFSHDTAANQSAVFSIRNRSHQQESPNALLFPPIMENKAINVADWFNHVHPKLNGEKLILEAYEESRCLAISPDAHQFILGTEWYLKSFDPSGAIRWETPVPGAALGVNIARKKEVVVAALGDGTIRWHRLDNGRELLAFFPHKDGKRWVLWTPKGYYDASPGGDALIGWHVNRGRDKTPDYYSASRFRQVYYRPDVIQKVLDTLDVDKALELADKERGKPSGIQDTAIADMLPPVVSILSPNDGDMFEEPKITMKYAVRSLIEEKITGVLLLLDGKPVTPEKESTIIAEGGEETRTAVIAIPWKDCIVSVIATNAHGPSDPAIITLKCRKDEPHEKPEPSDFTVLNESADKNENGGNICETNLEKPVLYLLSVGVSDYKNKMINSLKYAAKDACDIADVFGKQRGLLYSDVHAKPLENALCDDINDGLDWLEGVVTEKDVAAIFMAGHGINDANNNFYFLPSDADPKRRKRTFISYASIRDTVRGLPGKTLLFMDTCHSGNVFSGTRAAISFAAIDKIVSDLSSAENGAVVFAACTGEQVSYEDSEWENGAFTKALLEGLSGEADKYGRNHITLSALDDYVDYRVRQLTDNRQTPTMAKPNTIPNFPIAIVDKK